MTHIQYGVRIEWTHQLPDEEPLVITFDTRRRAEDVARSYDPWINPGRGAAVVEIVERQVLETYSEWEVAA